MEPSDFQREERWKPEVIAMLVWAFVVKGGRQNLSRENALSFVDCRKTKHVESVWHARRKDECSAVYDELRLITESLVGCTHYAISAITIPLAQPRRPGSMSGPPGASHPTPDKTLETRGSNHASRAIQWLVVVDIAHGVS